MSEQTPEVSAAYDDGYEEGRVDAYDGGYEDGEYAGFFRGEKEGIERGRAEERAALAAHLTSQLHAHYHEGFGMTDDTDQYVRDLLVWLESRG